MQQYTLSMNIQPCRKVAVIINILVDNILILNKYNNNWIANKHNLKKKPL